MGHPRGWTDDFYDILEVAPHASTAVIKGAHRRLATEGHPDHQGDDRWMARLNVARDVLCDAVQRADYDRYFGFPGPGRRASPIRDGAPRSDGSESDGPRRAPATGSPPGRGRPAPVPRLVVSPTSLGTVHLEPGKEATADLEVRNAAGGLMSGTISVDRTWLRVEPTAFDSLAGSRSLRIHVAAPWELAGGSDVGTVEIATDGGLASVSISMSVDAFPARVRRRRSLAMGGALAGVVLAWGVWESDPGIVRFLIHWPLALALLMGLVSAIDARRITAGLSTAVWSFVGLWLLQLFSGFRTTGPNDDRVFGLGAWAAAGYVAVWSLVAVVQYGSRTSLGALAAPAANRTRSSPIAIRAAGLVVVGAIALVGVGLLGRAMAPPGATTGSRTTTAPVPTREPTSVPSLSRPPPSPSPSVALWSSPALVALPAGSWSGIVESPIGDSFPVGVELPSSCGIGDSCGTSSYPTHDCRGTLTYTETTGSVHRFQERIIAPGLCANGTFEFRLVDASALAWSWTGEAHDGQPVHGVLNAITTPPAGPASCDLAASLRSQVAVVSSEVVIDNRSDAYVVLYWLDYGGERQLWGEVAAGEVLRQPTYETHPWLVTGPTYFSDSGMLMKGPCFTVLLPPAEWVVSP